MRGSMVLRLVLALSLLPAVRAIDLSPPSVGEPIVVDLPSSATDEAFCSGEGALAGVWMETISEESPMRRLTQVRMATWELPSMRLATANVSDVHFGNAFAPQSCTFSAAGEILVPLYRMDEDSTTHDDLAYVSSSGSRVVNVPGTGGLSRAENYGSSTYFLSSSLETGEAHLRASEDAGTSWKDIDMPGKAGMGLPPPGSSFVWMRLADLALTASGRIAVAGVTNLPATWRVTTTVSDNSGAFLAQEGPNALTASGWPSVAASGENLIVVYDSKILPVFLRIATSVDGGLTWIERPLGSPGKSAAINLFALPRTGIVADHDGRVLVAWLQTDGEGRLETAFALSRDGGITWREPGAVPIVPPKTGLDSPQPLIAGDRMFLVVPNGEDFLIYPVEA